MRFTPELKTLISIDADNLGSYKPENPYDFTLRVDALIGQQGKDFMDRFTFQVVSLCWLSKKVANEGAQHLSGYIIVKYFDINVIESVIRNIIHTTSGDNWSEFSHSLSKHSLYEFD